MSLGARGEYQTSMDVLALVTPMETRSHQARPSRYDWKPALRKRTTILIGLPPICIHFENMLANCLRCQLFCNKLNKSLRSVALFMTEIAINVDFGANSVILFHRGEHQECNQCFFAVHL